MIEKVENGDKAKDIVSGFEGIVLGITDWLYGCKTIGIKPQQLDKDGKPIDLIWFDEKQVEIIEKNIGRYG